MQHRIVPMALIAILAVGCGPSPTNAPVQSFANTPAIQPVTPPMTQAAAPAPAATDPRETEEAAEPDSPAGVSNATPSEAEASPAPPGSEEVATPSPMPSLAALPDISGPDTSMPAPAPKEGFFKRIFTKLKCAFSKKC